MRCVWHSSKYGEEERCIQNFGGENSGKKRPLGRLGIYGKMILKRIFEK
jgi:hypothetical protein